MGVNDVASRGWRFLGPAELPAACEIGVGKGTRMVTVLAFEVHLAVTGHHSALSRMPDHNL